MKAKKKRRSNRVASDELLERLENVKKLWDSHAWAMEKMYGPGNETAMILRLCINDLKRAVLSSNV